MKKILVLSAGRSDYDRYYPIIDALNNHKKINLYLYLTKAHLSKTFGKTINFVNKKFKILKSKINSIQHSVSETKKEISKNFLKI